MVFRPVVKRISASGRTGKIRVAVFTSVIAFLDATVRGNSQYRPYLANTGHTVQSAIISAPTFRKSLHHNQSTKLSPIRQKSGHRTLGNQSANQLSTQSTNQRQGKPILHSISQYMYADPCNARSMRTHISPTRVLNVKNLKLQTVNCA